MHDKRFIAGESVIPTSVLRGLIIWWFLFSAVGYVVSCPFLLLPVPPDQFLALTPRLSVRTRRGAIVQDAAISWPCKAPAMTVEPRGRAAVGLVFPRPWKHTGVNPAPTGSGAVCLQFSIPTYQLAIRKRVPVDL